jgi:hypothetical protein
MSARYWSHRVKWWRQFTFVMANSKSASSVKLESKPKKTRQGQGQNSLPSHGRKKMRGQGK